MFCLQVAFTIGSIDVLVFALVCYGLPLYFGRHGHRTLRATFSTSGGVGTEVSLYSLENALIPVRSQLSTVHGSRLCCRLGLKLGIVIPFAERAANTRGCRGLCLGKTCAQG